MATQRFTLTSSTPFTSLPKRLKTPEEDVKAQALRWLELTCCKGEEKARLTDSWVATHTKDFKNVDQLLIFTPTTSTATTARCRSSPIRLSSQGALRSALVQDSWRTSSKIGMALRNRTTASGDDQPQRHDRRSILRESAGMTKPHFTRMCASASCERSLRKGLGLSKLHAQHAGLSSRRRRLLRHHPRR